MMYKDSIQPSPATATKNDTELSYYEIARHWVALGFVVLPGARSSSPHKSPAVKGWGATTYEPIPGLELPGHRWHTHGTPHPTWEQYQEWDERHGDTDRALLCPASGPVEIVVIDVDDLRDLQWALEHFGPSPLRVTTGRVGGGIHLYYRTDVAIPCTTGLGPHGKVDGKSTGGYVICPGSRHRTGAIYQLYLEGEPIDSASITLDMLRSLPLIDPDKIEEAKRERDIRRAKERGEADTLGAANSGPTTNVRSISTCQRSISPDTLLLHRSGATYRAADAPTGKHYLSPFRPDSSPGCEIWEPSPGKRQFCDWGAGERYWISEPSAVSTQALTTLPTTGVFGFGDTLGGELLIKETSVSDDEDDALAEDVLINKASVPTRGSPPTHIEIPAGAWAPDVLPDLEDLAPDGGVVILDLAMGAGKTTWAVEQSRGRGLLVVTPTVALTGHCAHRYGATPYTSLTAPTAERVATTVHSCHQIQTPVDGTFSFSAAPTRELLVIDEADQVRGAFHSAPLRVGGRRAKEALLAHMSSAKWIILATADWTPDERTWWIASAKETSPDKCVITVHQDRAPGWREAHVFAPSAARQLALTAIDRLAQAKERGESPAPIAWAFSSQAGPEKTAKLLQRKHPKLKVFWTSSRNSRTPEIRRYLDDPDKLVGDHDVILYSPTIASGLSTDVPVQQVFATLTNSKMPVKTAGQMLARWRKARNKKLIMGTKATTTKMPHDRQYLTQLALGLEIETDRRVLETDLRDHYSTDRQTGERVATDPDFLDSWIIEEQAIREQMGDSLAALRDMCTRHGWGYHDHRDLKAKKDKALTALLAEVAEEIEEEHADAVAQAVEVTADEADEIRTRRGTVTAEEQHAAEKQKIEEYFGRDATPELVRADNRGKARRQVSDYVTARTYLDGERLWAALRDWHEIPRQHNHRQHHLQRAEVFAQFIRAITGRKNVRMDDLNGLQLTGKSITERMTTLLASDIFVAQLRELLGCNVSTTTKPNRLCMQLLKRLGIEKKSKQIRHPNGKRDREYTLSIATIHDLATAEIERATRAVAMLRAGKDPSTALEQAQIEDIQMPGPAVDPEILLATLLEDYCLAA